MDAEKKISDGLGKIKSIFWNLSGDKRIKSEELDDFNQAMTKVWDAKIDYDCAIGSLTETERRTLKTVDELALREMKLKILCEVLGMHRRGMERWTEYPIRFITIVNSNLRKANQPIYSENYFEAIDLKWRWLNGMINRDLHNIEMVWTMKEVYSNGGQEVKEKSAEILKMLYDDISYMESDIRAGKTIQEMKKKVIEHWYERLSTNNPAVEAGTER